MDGLKRYINDDRFRVDGDKNMRLVAFAFTIVFVWTGPYSSYQDFLIISCNLILFSGENCVFHMENFSLFRLLFYKLLFVKTLH